MPQLKCQTCGIEFHVLPSVIASGGGKYCSVHCRDFARRPGVTRSCPTCGEEFYAKTAQIKRSWAVYCSRRCLGLAELRGETKHCQYCGSAIYRTAAEIRKSRSQLFFCNRSCRASWTNHQRSGENHPNWKDDGKDYRRNLLRAGVEPVCQRCGNSDFRLLIAHHLDQDRTNNSLENLTWLCHNCHYLIHHYPEELAVFNKVIRTRSSGPASPDSATTLR